MNGKWRADIVQAPPATCSGYCNVCSAKGGCFPPESIQQAVAALGKMVWGQLTGERNRDFGILKLRIQYGNHTACGLRYSNIHCRAALNTYLNASTPRVSRYKSKPNCVARLDGRSIGAYRDGEILAINAT